MRITEESLSRIGEVLTVHFIVIESYFMPFCGAFFGAQNGAAVLGIGQRYQDMEQLYSVAASTISNPAIRRLMRRGGVSRFSNLCYKEIRGILFVYLCRLICDAHTYAAHSGSPGTDKFLSITNWHIECAVKLQPGRRLYTGGREGGHAFDASLFGI